MASQWLRWNSTTHIFEYSTNNGSSYAALPLDASVINEGTLDDARLSANVALLNAANIFTNAAALSIQNANPYVEFKETDQGADLKFWRVGAQGGLFNLDKLTDALASTNLISIDRNGLITVTKTTTSSHVFTANLNGANGIRIEQLSSGTAAAALISLANDIGSRTVLYAIASGFTTAAPFIADSSVLNCLGAGGLNISAGHASGVVNIYTAGSTVAKATFDTTGNLNLLNANGGIFEHGRATKLGEWTAYTNTWGSSGTQPTVGNSTFNSRYSLIGKMCVVSMILSIGSTATIGTGTYTFTLPFTADGTIFCIGSGYYIDASGGAAGNYAAMPTMNTTTTFQMIIHGNGAWSATVPVVPAVSDVVRATLIYYVP